MFLMKLVVSSPVPKLGQANNLKSRQVIVHSLVHTESLVLFILKVGLLIWFGYSLISFTISHTLIYIVGELELKLYEKDNKSCILEVVILCG